ncbi:hypothetical protein CHS0354_000358 [Potamilus streckersoni]|uniref:Heat shock 70 kDa protein 12B n=1 Tax=Potamilus streckersoni TaxID=2493646 RepID=A0AAE0T6A4_9BIVA|nr:hypothetical protein CHS0354_000358 [Potamilus streckersoni]
MALKGKDHVLVVAIDFGTAYSGYAFQFKHDFDKDPTKISAPQAWNGGKANLMSYKTPTCLLLDKDKKIDKFGFEAEEKYANLCMDGENETWYYFRRFKMKLQEGEGLKKDSQLQDETGKKMPALQVFSLSIQCLMSHLMKMLDKQGTGVKKEEIHWVITVPAIWNDSAKQFMRTAAEETGILSGNLDIALEPEAASLYCQYLPIEKFCTQKGQVHFGAAPTGTKYMVLDLGGGTADITMHEKLEGSKLKEIAKASGGPWGGTAVDAAFFKLLTDIVGNPVMTAFQMKEMYDYLDLLREFESTKRNLTANSKEMLTMKLPASLQNLCNEKKKCTFKECVQKSDYSNQIKLVSDKMRLDPELVRDLFRQVTDKIVDHVEKLLQKTPGVSMILLVGGFSESGFVQDVIRSKFQDKLGLKVIVPREAGLSVLNGAVIFGWKPEIIEARVLRYTYGVKITPEFDPGKHPASKRIMVNQKPHCADVFSAFIEVDTEVANGYRVLEVYNTLTPYQICLAIQVYLSPSKNPNFVTDPDCQLMGTLNVIIPDPTEEQRNVIVVFIFGDTELHAVAMEEENQIPFTATFHMIE